MFTPAWDHWLRAAFCLGAGTLLAGTMAAFGWYQFGTSPRDQGPVEQPIQFSHRHHVEELKIDCRFCHSSVEFAATAGFPDAETCLTCHAHLFADSPMLEPLRRSAASGEPLKWNRVHDLGDFVYFDHSIHVNKGVPCMECHGEVSHMALTQQAKPLTMGWCLECHQNPNGRLAGGSAEVFASAVNGTRKANASESAAAGSHLSPASHPDIDTHNLTDCSTCHR